MSEDKREKDWGKIADEVSNVDLDIAAQGDNPEPEIGFNSEISAVSELLEHPDYQALQEKMTQTEQALHEQQDKVLRLASEMENVRRRAEQDKLAAHRYGVQKLCEDLIPVMDSLEQALLAAEQAEGSHGALIEGVQMTLNIMNSTLEKYNVVAISPSQGDPFDPHHHEAMSMVPSTDVAHNGILVVFQKGYKIHDRVIRPARVVVAKAPE